MWIILATIVFQFTMVVVWIKYAYFAPANFSTFNFEINLSGFYSLCYQRGTVKLMNFFPPTDLMQELFQGSTPMSKIFLKSCRVYNNQLSFASITMNEGKFRLQSQ